MVVETGSYQGFGWSSTLDVEFDVAGVHTGDSHIDAVGLTRIREFVLNPNAQRAGAASDAMCVEHEATTKTQPRNGIRIRCHDDDLRFETIIASKSTTPAIQSRPTSVPSEARHALT
ncbi:MAG: hypothetical protein WBW75_22315 [Mycobacterium sp.]|uniref:hypothetical protein n=1 Tax=Mycobacterium sp. TaxID=1785 RepID=UPI003C6755D4